MFFSRYSGIFYNQIEKLPICYNVYYSGTYTDYNVLEFHTVQSFDVLKNINRTLPVTFPFLKTSYDINTNRE